MSPERKRRGEKRTKQAPVLFRREVIAGVLALGGAAALGKWFGEKIPKDDLSLIKEEIKRLGIKPNLYEQSLWAKIVFPPLRNVNFQDKGFQNEVAVRLIETLNVMERSENPYFKEAIAILKPLRAQDRLTIGVSTTTPEEASARTYQVIKEGELRLVLEYSISTALGKKYGIDIALKITHEAQHVKDMVSWDNPSLSLQERFDLQSKRREDPREFLRGEARAYAIQARAFIWQVGLMNITPSLPDTNTDLAANFLRNGGKEDSPGWLQYIRQNWIKEELEELLKPTPAR